ncbi:MAG: hypothetical protein J6R35_00640 [Clostridia bacterium]|nr:hypothetical protein [Clostridia bacterium]
MELAPLKAQACDETHTLKIPEIDGDFYVEFKHEMTKEHYLSFVSYLGYDRVITVRLYPEGDASVRLPRAYLGKILYYCNKHGLFEYQLSRKK